MNKHAIIQLLLITLITAACMPVQPPTPTADGTAAEATPIADATPTETTPTETTPAATAEATIAPAAEAQSSGEVVMVESLGEAECEFLQTAISTQLNNIDLSLTEGDFASEIGNLQGSACFLTARGTGEVFGNFVDTAQLIRELLLAQGWSEDVAFLADGPTGTLSGYVNEDRLALVSVGWNPSDDADCPDDQPISACELEPSQQIYTVEIVLMEVVQ